MDYKKEEIINALKIIKDICDSNVACRYCPLSNIPHNSADCCMINNTRPDRWELNNPQKESWKAFK